MEAPNVSQPTHLARLTYNTAVATDPRDARSVDPRVRYCSNVNRLAHLREAMVADLGIDAASKLGAGMVSLNHHHRDILRLPQVPPRSRARQARGRTPASCAPRRKAGQAPASEPRLTVVRDRWESSASRCHVLTRDLRRRVHGVPQAA